MALIKRKNVKGYDYEYWNIKSVVEDKFLNCSYITMALFKDKDYYNSIKKLPNITDYIAEYAYVTITGYNLLISDLYPLLKVSVITPDGVEQNFFVDSEDDLN